MPKEAKIVAMGQQLQTSRYAKIATSVRKPEVQHSLLHRFNHMISCCGFTAYRTCRVYEGDHTMSRNHFSNKHGGPKKFFAKWKTVRICHTHWSGVI